MRGLSVAPRNDCGGVGAALQDLRSDESDGCLRDRHCPRRSNPQPMPHPSPSSRQKHCHRHSEADRLRLGAGHCLRRSIRGRAPLAVSLTISSPRRCQIFPLRIGAFDKTAFLFSPQRLQLLFSADGLHWVAISLVMDQVFHAKSAGPTGANARLVLSDPAGEVRGKSYVGSSLAICENIDVVFAHHFLPEQCEVHTSLSGVRWAMTRGGGCFPQVSF